MAHTIKLSKALQLVDDGPPTESAKTRTKTTGGSRRVRGGKDTDLGVDGFD